MSAVSEPWIKTIEEVREFVLREGVIGIFGSQKKADLPSLWDAVDYPVDNPDGKGWGPRVGKVWGWKNELPQRWPDEIFYGKMAGGLAILASMDYVRNTLYPSAHVPVSQCSALARKLYGVIRLEAQTTPSLKRETGLVGKDHKAKFDRALKELQVTLNIARLNDADAEGDTWVPFTDQYPEFDE